MSRSVFFDKNSIPGSEDSRRIPFERPILVAHQPEFLPWLGFISKAAMGDVYLLLDSVQFRKQYFQHRNKIRTKSGCGWNWLILPLVRESVGRDKNISDAKISKGVWAEQHLHSLKYSYSKAPYFSEVYDELEKIYGDEVDSLSDFNTRFINLAFKMFNITIPVYRTSDLIKAGYEISGSKTDLIISMCRAVGAKTFVSGPFGKGYLDKEPFRANGMNLVFQLFRHPIYSQIHGEFVPALSFVDLLFNHGPSSVEILGKSDWEPG